MTLLHYFYRITSCRIWNLQRTSRYKLPTSSLHLTNRQTYEHSCAGDQMKVKPSLTERISHLPCIPQGGVCTCCTGTRVTQLLHLSRGWDGCCWVSGPGLFLTSSFLSHPLSTPLGPCSLDNPSLSFFLKTFFDVDHFFLKSLLNLLQYCFCFMFWFLARRHVGS